MSCDFYRWNGGIFGDYWCDKNNCRVNEDTYYKYCRGYDYRDCPVYRRSDSSGCFITTVVCDILGKKDNDKVLQTLREFRDNVLQKNKKYEDLLKGYDNIGPRIADAIVNDKDNKKLASFLYSDVIVPISKQIENKNYSRAINNYEIMTLSLINYYGIKHEYNEAKDKDYGYKPQEFDQKTAGHGKRRVRAK